MVQRPSVGSDGYSIRSSAGAGVNAVPPPPVPTSGRGALANIIDDMHVTTQYGAHNVRLSTTSSQWEKENEDELFESPFNIYENQQNYFKPQGDPKFR